MLQHLEWGAEGEGDYFLFSIHSLKMRSKEFFQRFYGQDVYKRQGPMHAVILAHSSADFDAIR